MTQESFTITFDLTEAEDRSEVTVEALTLSGTINGVDRTSKITHPGLIEFIYEVGLYPLLRAFNEVTDDSFHQSDTAVESYDQAVALREKLQAAVDSEDDEAVAQVLAEAAEAFSG